MILGIVQARMSSTRLPGKVMMPVLGEPMLARQVERLKRARSIDRLIIATTTEPGDDPVASLAAGLGLETYRGSLADVLDRYYQAALRHRPSHVVRLTADCPLADWDVINQLVNFGVEGGFDYASNVLRPTWPDGLDAEIMTFQALETAWTEARAAVEREHVTPFIVTRPDRFRHGSLEAANDLSRMRWTVDRPEDFQFVSRVYEELHPRDAAFTTADVLDLLREKPEIAEINRGIARNEARAPNRNDEGAKD